MQHMNKRTLDMTVHFEVLLWSQVERLGPPCCEVVMGYFLHEEDLVCIQGDPVMASTVIQETRMVSHELWL